MIKVLAFFLTWTPSTLWGGKRLFDAPLQYAKALFNDILRKSSLSSPLRDCLGFTIEVQDVIVALIVGLIFARHPSAIFFAVWAIIVFALYGVLSGRPISHICKKTCEVIPSRINSNSSSAVIWKRPVLWIQTSISKVAPNAVFRTSIKTMRYWPRHIKSFLQGQFHYIRPAQA